MDLSFAYSRPSTMAAGSLSPGHPWFSSPMLTVWTGPHVPLLTRCATCFLLLTRWVFGGQNWAAVPGLSRGFSSITAVLVLTSLLLERSAISLSLPISQCRRAGNGVIISGPSAATYCHTLSLRMVAHVSGIPNPLRLLHFLLPQRLAGSLDSRSAFSIASRHVFVGGWDLGTIECRVQCCAALSC
jgi:hypothetical protein